MSTEYPEIIQIDLPATAKYLSVLSACIAEMLARVEGIEQRESLTYTIQLAAHEACANIVDHAYTGAGEQRIVVVLTLLEQPRRFMIDMYDNGESFDLERTSAPTFEEPQVRGYGLYIIRSLMDEVSYQPAPGNNHWCLMKHL